MTKNMLIDATHAEETRVVVLDGNRLEDYDVETSTKRQLKGNIYLAKVVRVEPSLQAAFVEYGGGRHGFLAFGEIHPDYYQIPIADRQRLLEMQAEEARREEEEEDRAAAAEEEDEAASHDRGGHRVHEIETAQAEPETIEHDPNETAEGGETRIAATDEGSDRDSYLDFGRDSDRAQPATIVHEVISGEVEPEFGTENQPAVEFSFDAEPFPEAAFSEPSAFEADEPTVLQSDEPETIEAESPKRASPRYLRSYKIQEVIKRRQILLIQVVKEERGTKGAALTTFISLAGRFCVLMPNSPRGGGISRKITSAADRRRLKEITAELAVPKGMGLIVRTAGAARPKPEIKRDCEYLMRLWDDIREHTMKSVAPAQIYEEASLIKRAIRDVYSRDIDEVIVDGEDGWRQAHEFMRMLMPSHAKKVRLWRDTPVATGGGGQPLFARYQVDVQLDAMMSPTVQLKSGGYLVINQAEALVAVDVNSGRSTRERGIEETALRTNLEAADEVARQLRLRDLAGLIVIDFIDMESKKNNAMVERRIKEALKNDRARIQIGQISHFGLLEMSRQRLRPSLTETSFITCAHCNGLGLVRSTESAAIQVLRTIEEEGGKRRSAEIVVYAASSIAMYIFNHKRERLSVIEQRYAMRVTFAPDESLLPPNVRIERLRALVASDYPTTVTPDAPPAMLAAPEPEIEEEDAVSFADERGSDARGDDEDGEMSADSAAPRPGETAEESEQRGRRRRRRRRGGRREDGAAEASGGTETGVTENDVTEAPEDAAGAGVGRAVAIVAELPLDGEAAPLPTEDEEAQRRRRGRRGGRRRKPAEEGPSAISEPGAEQPDLPPVYAGPTPANPFGGHEFDIFDVLERAEEQAARSMGVTIAASAPPVPEAAPVEVPEPEAVVAEPVMEVATPEIIEPTPAQAEAEEVSHRAADAAPVAEVVPAPVVETVVGPAIQPILIGGEAPAPAEKKLGWWRR